MSVSLSPYVSCSIFTVHYLMKAKCPPLKIFPIIFFLFVQLPNSTKQQTKTTIVIMDNKWIWGIHETPS